MKFFLKKRKIPSLEFLIKDMYSRRDFLSETRKGTIRVPDGFIEGMDEAIGIVKNWKRKYED